MQTKINRLSSMPIRIYNGKIILIITIPVSLKYLVISITKNTQDVRKITALLKFI